MRRALAGFGLALMLATGALAQSAALEVRVRLAVRKLEQGDALGAMLDLDRVIAEDDRYWQAYYQRGRAQAAMGDDLGARSSFQSAAELDPGNADLHFLMASISWQLTDFETAWMQAIAAIQAGYDRGQVEQLMKGLRTYSDEPPDLEARLAAPRVVVSLADADADADLVQRLQGLGLELRSGLFVAPGIALVQNPAIAGYELTVAPAEDGSGFSVVLVELATAEERLRGAISGSGDVSEAETQLQMMDQVDVIEKWFMDNVPRTKS